MCTNLSGMTVPKLKKAVALANQLESLGFVVALSVKSGSGTKASTRKAKAKPSVLSGVERTRQASQAFHAECRKVAKERGISYRAAMELVRNQKRQAKAKAKPATSSRSVGQHRYQKAIRAIMSAKNCSYQEAIVLYRNGIQP